MKSIFAITLFIAVSGSAWAQPLEGKKVDLNIVAHQDDDILFMNPDILKAVVSGRRQVTVFITAGNVYMSHMAYALARERGAIDGYVKLLQLADAIRAGDLEMDFTEKFTGDSVFPVGYPEWRMTCAPYTEALAGPGTVSWQTGTRLIGSRNVDVATIGEEAGRPRATLIFLRVHSSGGVAGGSIRIDDTTPTTLANLEQLFAETQTEIESPFPDISYTKDELISQLVEIMKAERPEVVRTQDTAPGIDVDGADALQVPNLGHSGNLPLALYDHSDHVWGGRFAEEALRQYRDAKNKSKPAYETYKGYNVEWSQDRQARLNARFFCLKKSIMYQYALHDEFVIDNPQAMTFEAFSYLFIGYQDRAKQRLPQ